MDVRIVKQLLRSAATGSALLLTVSPLQAGKFQIDQPSRPHVSAADAQNWGYNPTCWQRFPAVPPCDSSFGCGMNAWSPDPASAEFGMPTANVGGGIPVQGGPYPDASMAGGMIYAPQSGLVVPQYAMPGSATIAVPQPVMPQLAMPQQGSIGGRYSSGNEMQSQVMQNPQTPMQGMTPSFNQMPAVPHVTTPVPGGSTQEVRTFNSTPSVPAMPLPPLPAPPSQSSALPNRLMIRPDGRIGAVPVRSASQSMTAGAQMSRYGAPLHPASQGMPTSGGIAAGTRYGSPATRAAVPVSNSKSSGGRYR